MSIISPGFSAGLPTVHCCPHCEKVFRRELQYKRHVSYCLRARTKRKGRPKSCMSCSLAKSKCSFDQPQCSRCTQRGLFCVYETPHRATHGPQPGTEVEHREDSILFGKDLGRELGQGSTGALANGAAPSQSTRELQSAHIELAARLDFEQGIDGHAVEWTDYWGSSIEATGFSSARYSSVQSNPLRSHDPNFAKDPSESRRVMYRQPGMTTVEQGTGLVLQIIRAFPAMMLRTQTFPPFIHQHWHSPRLPEKLATCMSISQLFAARTPATSPFLWRSIDSEEQRFRDDVLLYPASEVFTAMQALVIYIIMAIIDQSGKRPPRYGHLTRTLKIMTTRFVQVLDTAPFAETEWSHPSNMWEDWIFAESHRRFGCLWFVISRIVCPDSDLLCPTSRACRSKPLCTAKGMWEARSREEWETERAFFNVSLLPSEVSDMGALMDACHGRDPLSVIKLDAWEANTDKMGMLLSIAASLFDQDLEQDLSQS